MSAFYCLLEQEALLHITGPDTLTFLQGQTTCDTRKLDAGQGLPGAYCTPQGRMVCDFLLAQLGEEHFALRLRADILASAAATFGKYIVFSKADLDAGRSDWQVVACWGDEAAALLQGLIGDMPAGRFQAATGDGYVLLQLDEAGKQFEAWIDMHAHRDHFEALQEVMSEGSCDTWNAGQIRAGIGRVEGPTVEEFLPQMLNYDLTGHVSFDKGCYTGQEIVARLHYRGKAKRRMYLASAAGVEKFAAGTSLFSAAGDQSVGTVVNSAPAGEETLCLVSATEAGIADGLRVNSPDGPALTIGELPYA